MGNHKDDFIVRYLRVAAWSVLLGAVGASLVVGLIVYNVMLNDFARSIQAGIVNLASNSFSEGVNTDNAEGIAQFDAIATPLLKAKSYLAITIYDAQGEVVYTTPGSTIEPSAPVEKRALQEALKGRTQARMESVEGVSVYHVVAPLKGLQGGPAPGALSGQRPLWMFLEGTLETIGLLATAIILFACVAYGVLWVFARRAKKEVDRHASVASALQGRLSTSLKDAELQAIGTLQALSSAVDAKDVYTAQHSLNVADYACAIAREMQRDDLSVELERAGLLHDVGKIGVAEALLQKPGNLTESEMALVAEHSRLGASIIKTIPFLEAIVPAVTHHHEHWDGSGYPDGLVGEAIPLQARILATADAFDAMTTSRPYRAAVPVAEAKRELIRCRGSQFDPSTVDAMLRALDAGNLRVRNESNRAAS